MFTLSVLSVHQCNADPYLLEVLARILAHRNVCKIPQHAKDLEIQNQTFDLSFCL